MAFSLSERDICSRFITPALHKASWDQHSQIREEWGFTNGRIIVRGKLVSRGLCKRADYVLFIKPHIPLAVIEAKNNNHSIADGMKQAASHVRPRHGSACLAGRCGLVLPPELPRLAAGMLWQRCIYEGGEVALKDVCAAASWPG